MLAARWCALRSGSRQSVSQSVRVVHDCAGYKAPQQQRHSQHVLTQAHRCALVQAAGVGSLLAVVVPGVTLHCKGIMRGLARLLLRVVVRT